MSKPKLIVLEGPDSVGKTTQVRELSNHFNARVVHQPSATNAVGFLRKEVKFNESYSPFERQLLYSVSHSVDAYSEFNSEEAILLDRSYISSLVYGQITGLTDTQVDLLFQILQKVYLNNIKDKYDVTLIFMDRLSRYKEELTDNFEKSFEWNHLRDGYFGMFDYLATSEEYVFSPSERVFLYNVKDFSKEKVTEDLVNLIHRGI